MQQLEAWIRARGLTQEAAAAELGVSGVALHRWRHGTANPSHGSARTIQRVCGIDPCLFCDVPARKAT
jgi:transcriptional regulator with XRE-family HTH domain